MPRIHPQSWEDGVMPLAELPEHHQLRIAELVERPRPPSRWLDLGLAQIQSRAWWEWHWRRGKRLRIIPSELPARRKIPDGLRLAVYERDGYKCLHCGSRCGLTLDHIHPWSLGGADTYTNLQTLCRPCNSRKGAKV